MSVLTIGAWLVIGYTCLIIAGLLCVLWDCFTHRHDTRQDDARRFECVSEEAEAYLRGWTR